MYQHKTCEVKSSHGCLPLLLVVSAVWGTQIGLDSLDPLLEATEAFFCFLATGGGGTRQWTRSIARARLFRDVVAATRSEYLRYGTRLLLLLLRGEVCFTSLRSRSALCPSVPTPRWTGLSQKAITHTLLLCSPSIDTCRLAFHLSTLDLHFNNLPLTPKNLQTYLARNHKNV